MLKTRKSIIVLLVAIMAIALSFSLVGCKKNKDSGSASAECSHTWTDWTTTKEATCLEDGEKKRICSTCADIETETVTALGHDLTNVAEVAATCAADGVSAYKKCSRCDYTEGKEVIPALTHVLIDVEEVAATCTTEGVSAHKKCTNCDYTEGKTTTNALGHDLDDVAEVAATCTTDGVSAHQKCSRCDYTEGKTTINALGHDLDDVAEVAATCTADGVSAHQKCSRCDYTEGKTTLSALGHDLVNVAEVAATCTTDGVSAHQKCSRCDYSVGKTTLSALGHDLVNVAEIAATCTTEGVSAHQKCSRCDYTEGKTTLSALGHDLVNVAEVAATCTTEGVSAHQKCSRCDYTVGKTTIAALGHSFAEDWTSDDNNHWHAATCEHSDEKKDLAAHNWDSGVITTYPTDTDEGVKTFTCSVCEKTKTESIPVGVTYSQDWSSDNDYHWHAALGTSTSVDAKAAHTFDAGVITREATCGLAGEKTFTCSVCNKKVTESIDKLAHTFSEDWSNDENKHWHAATCGHSIETKDSEAHLFTIKEGASIAATCTTQGKDVLVCATCGYEKTVKTDKLAHDFETSTTPATCTADGIETRQCKNCVYKTDVILKAEGHSWDIPKQTCTSGQSCSKCDATTPKLGHDYSKVTKDATCDTAGEVVSTCSRCNDVQRTESPALGHLVATWTFDRFVLDDGETCKGHNVSVGYCSRCEKNVEKTETTVTYAHNEKASIKTEATCSAAGIMLYKCQNCPAERETEIAINAEAHNWDEGVTEGTVTTYTCSLCDATKTVISAKDETEASVDKTTLAEVGEIELKEASIKLDNATLGDLGEDIKISADTLKDEDRTAALDSLDADKREKLGDNPIYNFGMTSGDAAVSNFSGKVKITVPYTLAEGEDPECIAIWFINDSGETEEIPATYSNGFASFETNHFSYYTVTRLSAAERCKLYGHSYKDTVIAAICMSDGYTIKTCMRCGDQIITDIVAHTGHSFTNVTTEPTCEENGSTVYTCEKCDYSYQEVLLALGHSFVEDETKAATCQESGYIAYKCSNENCTETYKTILTKKPHTYVDDTIAPTCTTTGKTTHKCSVCNFTYEDGFKSALGHNYIDKIIEATCTTDGYTSHICSRCQDALDNTDVVAAHHVWDIDEPTCGRGQKCINCDAVGAPATGEHSYNGNGLCEICGDGCQHQFESTVIEPTCKDKGYTMNVCSICSYEEKINIKPALGHTGTSVCSVCGIDLLNDTFYTNGLRSLNAQDFVLKLNSFELTGQAKVENAELSLSFDDEGNLGGYGSAKVFIYNSVLANVEGWVDAKVIIEDSTAYVYMDMNNSSITTYSDSKAYTGAPEEYFVKMPLSYVFVNLVGQDMGIPAEMLGVVKDVISIYKTKIEPLIYNVLVANDAKLNSFLKPILERLFTIEKGEFGYNLTLNTEAFKALNQRLATADVETLVNDLFGKDGYQNIKNGLVDMLDLTVTEFLTKINDAGLSISEVLDIYSTVTDYMVAIGLMPEGQIPDLQNLLFNVLADVTIGELINQASGMEIDEIKTTIASAFDGAAEINVYEMIIGMMSSSSNAHEANAQPELQTDADAETDTNDAIDYIVESVNSVIDMIGEMLSISYSTDFDGYINNINIAVAGLPISDEDTLSLDITFTADDEPSGVDYDKIKDEIIANAYMMINSENCGDVCIDAYFSSNGYGINFEHTIDPNFVSFDEDGNMTYSFTAEKVYDTSYNGIFTKCVADAEFAINNNTPIAVIPDCGDWVKVSMPVTISYKTTTYTYDRDSNATTDSSYIYKENYPKNLITSSNDSLDDIDWVYESSYEDIKTNSIDFFYNVITKEIVSFFDYVNTLHEYEEDEQQSIKAVGCTDVGTRYWYCTDCGFSYIEYYTNGHSDDYTINAVFDTNERNCEKGVTLNYYCTECGDLVRTTHSNYHETYREFLDLTEYDVCERHEFYISKCACGYYNNLNGLYELDREWDEDKNEYYICYECGLKVTVSSVSNKVDCNMTEKRTYDFVKDNTTIKTLKFERTYESHNTHTYVYLDEGSETCSDGCYEVSICDDCGKETYSDHYYYHSTGIFKEIDLSQYGDYEGKLRFEGCACGYEFYNSEITDAGNYYNDYITIDGVECDIYTIQSNGLVIAIKYLQVKDEETCAIRTDVTVYIGYDVINKTAIDVIKFSTSFYGYDHENTEITAIFAEGSESCEDGILVTEKCLDCGATIYRNEKRNNHLTLLQETVDLTDYGCVCGGHLYYYECLCGASAKIDMDDCKCDLDWKTTDSINYDGQNFTNSYSQDYYGNRYLQHLSNSCEVAKCAVTDPQCTFTFYKIEYMTVEDCKVYRRTIYLFGYDEETGLAEKAIDYTEYLGKGHTSWTKVNRTPYAETPCTVPYDYICNNCREVIYSGSTTNHTYVTKENEITNNADGTVTDFSGRYCSVCDLGRTTTIVKNSEGNAISRVDFYTYESSTQEYGYMYYKGYSYQTLYKYSDRYDDYWTKTEYSYNFEGQCKCTRHDTNSYGNDSWTYDVECCNGGNWETVKDATCSQPGKEERRCPVCDYVIEEYEIAPGHSWYYDYDLGLYICDVCRMTNTNGADGRIILEDCTEDESDTLKVGYYDRMLDDIKVNFVLNVTLILHDADPDNNEVLIAGVDFNDDGHYVSFSKSEVVGLASQMNYDEEDYDIRLSFVPTNVQDELDYAVTFCELTVAYTYYDYDGSVLNKQLVLYGDIQEEVKQPTRDGFKFLYWATTKETALIKTFVAIYEPKYYLNGYSYNGVNTYIMETENPSEYMLLVNGYNEDENHKLSVDSTNITSVCFEFGLTKVANYSLYNFQSVKEVSLSNSITRIGDRAFYNCLELADIYFDGTQEQWNNIYKGSEWITSQNYTVHCTDGNLQFASML